MADDFTNGFENFGGGFDAFGGGASFDAEQVAPAAPTPPTPPLGPSGGTFNGIPFSQIKGLQTGQYSDLDAAAEAVMSLSREELARRRANSEAFQWVKTVVDKIEPPTILADGKKKHKNPKFLGWSVILNGTNGQEEYMTDAELLSYVVANCDRSGKLGQGDEGLQLRSALRNNRSASATSYKHTMVVSLHPMTKISKYDPSKLLAAKEIAYKPDGTPERVLKPGKPKEIDGLPNNNPEDYIDKYVWKKGFEKFDRHYGKNSKQTKRDKKSADAFNLLVFQQGLTGSLSGF